MANTTMKVGAKMGQGFKTEITASHKFLIDQPIAMGGENAGPNPMEIFLSSLPACICAMGRIISKQQKLNVKGMTVDVEGDIDKDFLLGKTDKGRAGFTEIRAYVNIDAELTDNEKEEFLSEITKRCPIADNILNATVVKESIR